MFSRPEVYSKPCKTSKMELFATLVKDISYIYAGSWIRLCRRSLYCFQGKSTSNRHVKSAFSMLHFLHNFSEQTSQEMFATNKKAQFRYGEDGCFSSRKSNQKKVLYYLTRKATVFKSLQINCWEINQVTSKRQMAFLDNTCKKRS